MSTRRRVWFFAFVFCVLGLALYLVNAPDAIASGAWFPALIGMSIPALVLAYIGNGIFEIWKRISTRNRNPPTEPSREVPPRPVGWNKTFEDLTAEMHAGVRKSIGHPEMDWAFEYEKSIAPPPPPQSVKDKWGIAARERNCYCGVWGTNPATFAKDGLSEGFCGICERCSELGHTRHFPGPLPYTGAWCDRCYRILKWTWPFRSLYGWGHILAILLLASFIWRMFGRALVATFQGFLK